MASKELCVDTLGADKEEQIGVYPCKGNSTHPGWRQTFKLRNHRDIAVDLSNNECFDVSRGRVLIYSCKFMQANQYFRYDLNTKQIFCGAKRENQCMDFDMKTKMVIVTPCSDNKITQKWQWSFVNETMLGDWINFGKPILDERESLEMEN